MGKKTESMKHALGVLVFSGGIALAQAQEPLEIDLKGTVNHGKDGTPVAGAAVSLALYPSLSTVSDENGKFALKGSVVGVRSVLGTAPSPATLAGRTIRFSVGGGAQPVSIGIFDLMNRPMGDVLGQVMAAGEYRVDAAPVLSRLPPGLYLVRVRVGSRITSFKVPSVGAPAGGLGREAKPTVSRGALAKSAGDVPDTLKVAKAGFRAARKVINRYTGTIPVILTPKLPAGDLKIYSEREMAQVDWAQNVDVQVWDGGTKLNGQYAVRFEGDRSWMTEFAGSPGWSGWAFVTKPETPEDISDWAGGSIHLAIKGTANSVALTVISEGMPQGSNVEVDVSGHGYEPDDEWHEVLIPMSAFEGTDLSRVTVYCALIAPSKTDTAAFDPSQFYQIDDLYYTLRK